MEVARNAKRQCIDLEAFDTQADSIVDFPTESVEKTAQQPFSSVKSHDADLADRHVLIRFAVLLEILTMVLILQSIDYMQET